MLEDCAGWIESRSLQYDVLPEKLLTLHVVLQKCDAPGCIRIIPDGEVCDNSHYECFLNGIGHVLCREHREKDRCPVCGALAAKVHYLCCSIGSRGLRHYFLIFLRNVITAKRSSFRVGKTATTVIMIAT